MRLTIKKQLFLFAISMLLIQGALSAFSYISLNSLQDNLNLVFKYRLPSIDNLVQADRDFQQSLVAERTLLINGIDPSEKSLLAKDYWKNRNQVEERFNTYKSLANSDKEKEIISKFEDSLNTWKEVSKEHLLIANNGEFSNELSQEELIRNSLTRVSKEFESAREKLDLLQEEVLSLGSAEFTQAQKDYKSAESLIMWLSLGGLLFSLIASWYMANSVSGKVERIAKDLKDRNNDLSSISDELAQKASDLASTSQEQASSVTETSSSLHEISQMIENNSQNTEKATSLVSESGNLIQDGKKLLVELENSIGSVEKSSSDMINSIDRNNKDLEEVINTFKTIKDKTNVINDIVFQTKLLSFNASVEAARAGAHGKGFSVVAEEIGNLAQESGASAYEITNLLEGSLSKVSTLIENSKKDLERSVSVNKEKISESVESSQRCNESFEKIAEKFGSVSEVSTEINEASKEQESGVSEINRAMQEINSSNEITSQSANQIEYTSQKLLKMVTSITHNIKVLEQIVGTRTQMEESEIQDTPSFNSEKPFVSAKEHSTIQHASKSAKVEHFAKTDDSDGWVDLDDDDFSQSA